MELARELGDPSAILRDIGVDARLEDFTGSLRPGQRSAEWRIRIPVGPVEWVTFDYFETPEDEDDDYDLVYGIDELDGWGVKLGIPDARRTGDTPFDLQPSLVRKFPLFGKVIGVSWGRVVENSRTANVASRLADDKSSTTDFDCG